jgi:hypothetical protein
MNNKLIADALKKFPNAKKIAVENFTMGYDSLSMEASMNLEMDAASYKWNTHTTNAIRYVLRHKHAFKTLAD